MPSVRVRRNTYVPLDDPVHVVELSEPRSLATIFVPPRSDGQSQPSSSLNAPGQAWSLDSPRAQEPASSEAKPPAKPKPRPRASSRVDQHVQSLKFISTRAPADGDGDQPLPDLQRLPSRTPSQMPGSPGKLEGRQINMSIRSGHEGQPGLVGSALSLPLGNSSSEDLDNIQDDVIEHLDVIDPQVATLSNLVNAANAIIFPPLDFYSRKPTVVLLDPWYTKGDAEKGDGLEDPLDRHVDDVLRKPARFKRTMQGIWSFLKTPLGIIAGIYGFLVVFWGAAIVFFLAKFINLHNSDTQGFWVEISSQIENGLFTATGLGLFPSRVLDTYRILKIWRYKRKTRLLRARTGLPQLYDVDDLPDPAYDPNYVHVLTEEEELDLHKLQRNFQHSQTWYRAHGTETHRAFPINTALLICCFNDGNSIFQILLCGVMWGYNRFQRPPWTTGSLIPLSFLCGIVSAIFIWRGGHKTKRTKEVREKLRKVLMMKGPYGARDVPIEVAVGVQDPVGTSGNPNDTQVRSNDEIGPAELDPDIEEKTQIHECMTIPASPQVPS